ncbi:hypothetical protein [Streptomyces misionensis]|uniref:hypothetical protein n=1 Tax=Streptomyces misionensis TaxID=67331 RepID=UPI00396B783B
MAHSPVRTVVLARSLADFHAWCRQTNSSPRDRTILYASGPTVLNGLAQVEIVRHGLWWDRLDEAALTQAVADLETRQNAQEDATVTSSSGPYVARN